MKTHPVLTAALLTLLHHTTTFAMDPQEAKGIIGELEQFSNDRIHQPASGRLEKEEEENQNTLSIGQEDLSSITPSSFSSSSSGSGSGEASFATLSESPRNETMHISEEDEKNITPAETSIVVYSNMPFGSMKNAHRADDGFQREASVQQTRSKWASERMGTALQIYCDYCLISMLGNEGLSTYTDKALARGADPQLIEDFKEYWNEAKVLFDSGDYSLTMSWIQLIEDLQEVIEGGIKIKSSSENSKLANFLNRAAQAVQASTRCQADSLRSSMLKQTEERTVSENQDKYLVNPFEESALTNYQSSSDSASSSSSSLPSSISNLSFPAAAAVPIAYSLQPIASIRPVDRIVTNQLASQCPEAGEYYRQAMKVIISDDTTTEWARRQFFEREVSYNFGAGRLASLAKALKKADNAIAASQKATIANQKDIAELWSKSAELYQELAKYYLQLMKTSVHNYDFHNSLKHLLGDFYYSSPSTFRPFDFHDSSHISGSSVVQLDRAAEALEWAIEATEANQKEIATLECKAAEQYQEAAEYYCQAAKILVIDIKDRKDFAKHLRYSFFERAATFARKSAQEFDFAAWALEKAIKFTAANQSEMAAAWHKKAGRYQEAAAYFRQAMKAVVSNNTTEHARVDEFESKAYAMTPGFPGYQ